MESANGQTGYAVELNSETDFVAKTPKFVEFADSVLEDAVKAEAASVDEVLAAASGEATVKEAVEEAAALFGEHVKVGQFAKVEGPHVEIYAHKKSAEMPPSIVAMIATDEAGAAVAHEAALQISAMGAQWLTREDVPADVVESERRVATEKSLAEGKPEKIVPKIVEGRLNASTRRTSCSSNPTSRIRPRPSVTCSRKSVAQPCLRSCRGRQGRSRVNWLCK